MDFKDKTYEEVEQMIEDLREYSARVAGGSSGESNYDPDTLVLIYDAADLLEQSLKSRTYWHTTVGGERFVTYDESVGDSWREDGFEVYRGFAAIDPADQAPKPNPEPEEPEGMSQ